VTVNTTFLQLSIFGETVFTKNIKKIQTKRCLNQKDEINLHGKKVPGLTISRIQGLSI